MVQRTNRRREKEREERLTFRKSRTKGTCKAWIYGTKDEQKKRERRRVAFREFLTAEVKEH